MNFMNRAHPQHDAANPPQACRRASVRRGFTLVEMVVVVAIIVLILGITLPAVSRMWDERKESSAINTLQGAIRVARRIASTPDRGEAGLFFMVDALGSQHIYIIEQEPLSSTDDLTRIEAELASANRFRIVDGRDYTIAKPFRIAPVETVNRAEAVAADNDYLKFSLEELAYNGFEQPPAHDWQSGQLNRNFFVVVFDKSGALTYQRPVLIHDPNEDGENGNNLLGDRTGLKVGDVDKFCDLEQSNCEDPLDLIENNNDAELKDMVLAPGNADIALTFASYRGFVLYDDETFNRLVDPQNKQQYLVDHGQPFYIVGLRGQLVEADPELE